MSEMRNRLSAISATALLAGACGCPRPAEVTVPSAEDRVDGGRAGEAGGTAQEAAPPALPGDYAFVAQVGHAAPVWAAALEDGRVVGIDAEGMLVLWTPDLREVLAAEHLGVGGVTAAAFGEPEGRVTVVIGTAAGEVRCLSAWEPSPCERQGYYTAQPFGSSFSRAVSAIARDAETGYTAVATVDGMLSVRDVAGADLWTREAAHTEKIASLAFSGDSTLLASAGADGFVAIWNVHDGRRVARLAHDGPVLAVAFAPDGSLATGAGNRLLRLWGGDPMEEIARRDGFAQGVAHLAVTAGGRRLVAADIDGAVYSLALPDLEPVSIAGARWPRDFPDREGRLMSFGLSRDDAVIAGGADGVIRSLAIAEGVRVTTPIAAAVPHSVAASPDGRYVAAGLTDGTIRLLDAERGVQVSTIQGGADVVTGLAFGADGSLAWGNLDGSVHLIRRDADDSSTTALRGHLAPVLAVVVSPDGSRIAAGAADGAVLVWEPGRSLDPELNLQGPVSHVLAVAFAPDGRTIWATGTDRAVWRWSASTGRSTWDEPAMLPAAGTRLVAIEGDSALAGTADGRVLAIDVDGEVTAIRSGGRAPVTAMVAAGCGPVAQSVLVGFGDGVVRVLGLAGAVSRPWYCAPYEDSPGYRAEHDMPRVSGEWLDCEIRPPADTVGALALSADGERLLCAGRSVSAVRIPDGEPVWRTFLSADGAATVWPNRRHAIAGDGESLVGFTDGSEIRRAGDPAVALLHEEVRPRPGPGTTAGTRFHGGPGGPQEATDPRARDAHGGEP